MNEETSPEIIIPCEIKMQVSGLHTRMVETGPGDFSQIGVYGLRWETNRQAPSFTPGRFYFENMRFLLTDKGSEWFAETPLYYPERGDKLDLYGYYPYEATTFSDSPVLSFQVAADQGEYSRYTHSDLCIAKEEGVMNSEKILPVRFYHMLSQLYFTIKGSDDFPVAELLRSKLIIRNAILDVTYALAMGIQGEVVSGEERGDIIPYGKWELHPENESIFVGYKVIIPPQVLGIDTYIELQTPSYTFECKFEPSITLRSGVSRIITFLPEKSIFAFITAEAPWVYDE